MRTKLAFSIIAHKSPPQIVALARAVSASGNYCVIHCNRRSGPDYRAAVEEGIRAAGLRNIRFIDSEDVGWGGRSILRVQLRCIAALVDWADDWTHLVNLSGQCLPTRPLVEIADELAAHRGQSFIEVLDLLTERPAHVPRYTHYHIEIAGKLRNTRIPRRLPRDFRLAFGGFWCILAREACVHIARSEEARRILARLRFARFPDELAFQTVLVNSPLAGSIVSSPRRLMIYPNDGAHPAELTLAHWNALTAPDILFARKFDPAVDSEVIMRLADRIRCDLPELRPSHA